MMEANNELEELSKKSFEVVVHLNQDKVCNSDSDESLDLSDTQDENGRPTCNIWKGQNHPLHVVGPFESDFMKNLKTYQVPPTVPLSMDTFCRVDANYSSEDPLIKEAFLLWKSPSFEKLLESKKKKQMVAKKDEDDYDENEELENLQDSESETEQEIEEHIESQRLKKLLGESVTGEILVFDEEYDVIRNLHAKNSISLTSYGGIPDEKIFGKTELLFDQLSPEEKALIRADTTDNNKCSDDIPTKVVKGEEKQVKEEEGSGDSVLKIQI